MGVIRALSWWDKGKGAASAMIEPKSILPITRWKIGIDKSAFDKLKIEESFWSVVVLSRVVNGGWPTHSHW
jgi:hypothetical protein